MIPCLIYAVLKRLNPGHQARYGNTLPTELHEGCGDSYYVASVCLIALCRAAWPWTCHWFSCHCPPPKGWNYRCASPSPPIFIVYFYLNYSVHRLGYLFHIILETHRTMTQGDRGLLSPETKRYQRSPCGASGLEGQLWKPESFTQCGKRVRAMIQVCNCSTWETEARES